jgi:ubiquitin carboxyl-terminal hydrolase 34
VWRTPTEAAGALLPVLRELLANTPASPACTRPRARPPRVEQTSHSVTAIMNAREDNVAQSAAADATAITASPPRRDPVEDADPSFTRKRPRLDCGSNSVRALSTDTESSARTAGSPREQQVEMTIRSHPPSSPVSAPIDPGHIANAMSKHPQNISPILIVSTDDESGSPPVMLIEEDEESAVGFTVQIDAGDHFQHFPWSTAGNYAQVVHDLPQYIQGCTLSAMFLHAPQS